MISLLALLQLRREVIARSDEMTSEDEIATQLLEQLVGKEPALTGALVASLKRGGVPTFQKLFGISTVAASPSAPEPTPIVPPVENRHDERGFLKSQYRTPDRDWVRNWPGRYPTPPDFSKGEGWA